MNMNMNRSMNMSKVSKANKGNKVSGLVTVVLVTGMLLVPAVSADLNPHSITYCEDAKRLNTKGKRWQSKHTAKPNGDAAYFKFINSSPWCAVIEADNPQHFSIIHYKEGGAEYLEKFVHKTGQEQWIGNNWRKIKKLCTAPTNLGIVVKKFRRQTPKKKKCLMTVKGNRLHVTNVGRVMKPLRPGARRR